MIMFSTINKASYYKPEMPKWSVSDGFVIDRECSTCSVAWGSTGTTGCKCDRMDYQFKDDITNTPKDNNNIMLNHIFLNQILNNIS